MNEAKELRLYTWTLYQLSPIQQGIQAAHAAVELAMKTNRERAENAEAWQTYCHWGETWCTMVLLNGGDVASMKKIHRLFKSKINPHPWAAFRESQDSLHGIMTSIAILIPEKIFGMAAQIRKGEFVPLYTLNAFEQALVELINDSGLAR